VHFTGDGFKIAIDLGIKGADAIRMVGKVREEIAGVRQIRVADAGTVHGRS
jgi:hypothetical protein